MGLSTSIRTDQDINLFGERRSGNGAGVGVGTGDESPTRSITFAVFDGEELVHSHTLRYSPQSLNIADMGLFRPEPTGRGLYVEQGGFYATRIAIRGTTGHRITKKGGNYVDGESELKELRTMLTQSFGLSRTKEDPNKYQIFQMSVIRLRHNK